jgi:carotenoid 1,2-hydratase
VFSPYYRWAQRSGQGQAENHCAINVALYGKGVRRWTMTERSQASVARGLDFFSVGPSQLRWHGDRLSIRVDERNLPWPSAVRGEITVHAASLSRFVAPLDNAGQHLWGPISPSARVEVNMLHPRLRWQGHGYLDSNEGAEPIDRPFRTWDWSRASLANGEAAVIYDVRQKHFNDRVLAMRFNRHGEAEPFEAPGRVRLRRSLWGIERNMRSAGPAEVEATYEDTPFYARSVVRSQLMGENTVSMHESLNVARLIAPSTQLMLPFKMPRVR